MNKSRKLPLLFRHVTHNLRGGFLVRPLTIALTLGCAGAFFSWWEESDPAISANPIVDRIASETEAMADEMMPLPRRHSKAQFRPLAFEAMVAWT